MNKFIKKMFGIEKIEAARTQAEAEADAAKKLAEQQLQEVVNATAEAERQQTIAEANAEAAKEAERLSKLSPKEIATEKKEPWVAVLDTHVNMDNLRNGFLELDWNEYFVVQLKSAGYIGATDEEVVDQWFSELCRNLGGEEGIDMTRRGAGYVNRALRDDGLTEIG